MREAKVNELDDDQSVEKQFTNLSHYHAKIIAMQVIRRAVDDVISRPNIEMRYGNQYKKNSGEYDAYNAILFLNPCNPLFKFYCAIVDMDPTELAAIAYRLILTRNPKGRISRARKKTLLRE